MPMFVRAGWLIPSDALIWWWNHRDADADAPRDSAAQQADSSSSSESPSPSPTRTSSASSASRASSSTPPPPHQPARRTLPNICTPGDSGASTLYKHLRDALQSEYEHKRGTRQEEEDTGELGELEEEYDYDCCTLVRGPSWKQLRFVLVVTDAGIFDLTPVNVNLCALSPRSARAHRVRELLEREGLDFEENGVRFYKMPVCMA